jgi:hypothetical protein
MIPDQSDPFLPLTAAARFIGTDEPPQSIYGLRAAVRRLGVAERNELGHVGIRLSVAEKFRRNVRTFGYLTPRGVNTLEPPTPGQPPTAA